MIEFTCVCRWCLKFRYQCIVCNLWTRYALMYSSKQLWCNSFTNRYISNKIIWKPLYVLRQRLSIKLTLTQLCVHVGVWMGCRNSIVSLDTNVAWFVAAIPIGWTALPSVVLGHCKWLHEFLWNITTHSCPSFNTGLLTRGYTGCHVVDPYHDCYCPDYLLLRLGPFLSTRHHMLMAILTTQSIYMWPSTW